MGASGRLGGAVAEQAIERGHEVAAIARQASRLQALEGAEIVAADVLDPDAIASAIRGSDVVVSAIADRSTAGRSSIPAAIRSLPDALPRAGVSRLAVAGGGGSLEIRPGVRALDEPGVPEEYRREPEAQAEALAIPRVDGSAIDWTYLSPPPHSLVPGERTGPTGSRAVTPRCSTRAAKAGSARASSPRRCSTRSTRRSSPGCGSRPPAVRWPAGSGVGCGARNNPKGPVERWG